MKNSPHAISLSRVCATPEELLKSDDLDRVLSLYNRDKKKEDKKWQDVTIEHIKQFPVLAEKLLTFWEYKVKPKIDNKALDNKQAAQLSDIVDRSFLHLATAIPHACFSIERLDLFRRRARQLMNNGYVAVCHHGKDDVYGGPVYPSDVEGKHEQVGNDHMIEMLHMPQVRHNGERIEFTNYIDPEDPQKIRDIAEQGELGFTQKGRDVSHISFATCLVDREKKSTSWSESVTVPNARFASHPLEQMRQYASGVFEGIGVEVSADGKVCVFRLEDHWKRMSLGGHSLGMPPISQGVFTKMIFDTIRANKEYIPPYGKGRLYIRPNWFDIGPKMHVGTSGENVLMMTAVPIGSAESYYAKSADTVDTNEKSRKKGKTIFFPYNVHRSTENGPGQAKADGNYGVTIPHIEAAEKEGMMGVMYMNEKGTAVEETNASSLVFLQVIPGQKTKEGKQKYRVLTPSLERGTVLDSITRKTIIVLARQELEWDVVDEDISPDELKQLMEKGEEGGIVSAFSAGTGAVLTPIHNIQRGNIHICDSKNEKGEWVRSFEIEKEKDAMGQDRIKGEHFHIGDSDSVHYTEAGKDLLRILLDAKSGVLSRKVSMRFATCEIREKPVLDELQRKMFEYRDWLTVVDLDVSLENQDS